MTTALSAASAHGDPSADSPSHRHPKGEYRGKSLERPRPTFQRERRVRIAFACTRRRHGSGAGPRDFFTTSLDWSPTDRFTLSGDVQYVKSHADMVSMTGFTQEGDQNG
ncbi:MAG: hypothetical protein KGL45_15550, partial [Gammaproteobacteria bacterium]|nr:hypothetical protein [Gammaproteobacteria bacterium]